MTLLFFGGGSSKKKCPFGCLNCVVIDFSSLWGKHKGLRWGELFSSFLSTAYRFLLCIKLPLKISERPAPGKEMLGIEGMIISMGLSEPAK